MLSYSNIKGVIIIFSKKKNVSQSHRKILFLKKKTQEFILYFFIRTQIYIILSGKERKYNICGREN
jgi:hypothetical protein